MRKSVGQAPTVGERNKNRVGRLPTSEQNWKIILSDEVRCRIGNCGQMEQSRGCLEDEG
jgi:hypothetical protein